MPVYSRESVVTTILECQHLNNNPKNNYSVTKEEIYRVVNAIKALQIDTLQMVKRSHYLVLWSRLGHYNDEDLDKLCYSNDRKLFEYWYHAACIIPISEFPYRIPIMEQYRQGNRGSGSKWAKEVTNAKIIDEVLKQTCKMGQVKSSDFENQGVSKGSWWNWKPTKRALEHLYNCGDLSVANRENFNKVYGLTKKVIPKRVIGKTPVKTYDETCLHDLYEALKSTGISTPKQLANYTHMKLTQAKPLLETLLKSQKVVSITGRNLRGEKTSLIIHKDNMPILRRAADEDLFPKRTTLLSPFDNLFWAKGRDVDFFGFEQILECYKPRNLRRWGYFCLPILHQGKLIGRIDPKLDRRTNTLELRKIHLEENYKPDEKMVHSIKESILNFMKFHNATNVSITSIGTGELSAKLRKSL